MLKVQIKDPKSGFRMNMPIPYHLFIDLFVRKSVVKHLLSSHAASSEMKRQEWLLGFVENMDFEELRRTLHMLKSYKGLNFVDIEAADGTIVKIFNK